MTTARKIAQQLGQRLKDDWRSRARPSQLAPPGDWTVWLLMSGRGFGKTLAGSSWIHEQVEAGVRRAAIIGATDRDTRYTMIEGASGILATAPSWNRPTWEPSKKKLEWPNGAIAMCFSSEQPDRMRGPEFEVGWLDEMAAFQQLDKTWSTFLMALRVGARPRCMISTTPRPLKLIKDLVKRDGQDVRVVRGTTYENRQNLAASFFEQVIRKYENTRIGRQELLAELLVDTPGALWSYDLLEQTRVAKAPPMKRLCVAIDPAVSTGEDSDETGIIVAGTDEQNHGFVIEDLSGKYSPIEWARRAVAAYDLHEADAIVCEKNMGGDLVMSTLRSVNPNIRVVPVHASRGKFTRAEPVSSLFEQHRCHIVGTMPLLEDELCSFAPGEAGSPDRLDAMVWGLTHLMLGFAQPMTFGMPFSYDRPRPTTLAEISNTPQELTANAIRPGIASGPEYSASSDWAGTMPAAARLCKGL